MYGGLLGLILLKTAGADGWRARDMRKDVRDEEGRILTYHANRPFSSRTSEGSIAKAPW